MKASSCYHMELRLFWWSSTAWKLHSWRFWLALVTETHLEVGDAPTDGTCYQYEDEKYYSYGDDGVFCLDNEENVSFDVLLDENPVGIGWSLVCNGDDVIWNVAAGTIAADIAENKITENTCVPNSQTPEMALVQIGTMPCGMELQQLPFPETAAPPCLRRRFFVSDPIA